MINRRSQEINEIKNRFENSGINLSLKQEVLYIIQNEKDKMRENINLMNTNSSIPNQLNYRSLSGVFIFIIQTYYDDKEICRTDIV